MQDFVTLLTNAEPTIRLADLGAFKAAIRDEPTAETARLLILKKEGMVGALLQFMNPGNESETAVLWLIHKLVEHTDSQQLQEAEAACKLHVFQSTLFPLVVQATTSLNPRSRRCAYIVMGSLVASEEVKTGLFESPGVPDALTHGLQIDSDEHSDEIHNICVGVVSLVAMDRVEEFPYLVAGIVGAFCKKGASSRRFQGKVDSWCRLPSLLCFN
jgi:hypothetical protein